MAQTVPVPPYLQELEAEELLVIQWPRRRPFGDPVTAEAMDFAWPVFVDSFGLNSIEGTIIAAIFRSVYSTIGLTAEVTPPQ